MQSLILGTAQWGLDYGVTNAAGRLDDTTVAAIGDLAGLAGIHQIDTAAAYGDSETRVAALSGDWQVQTKISAAARPASNVRAQIEAAVALFEEKLAGLLVHDWPTLSAEERAVAARALEAARDEDLVPSVGVSTYDPGDLAAALDAFAVLDIVQAPVNVLDQRLEGSADVQRLRSGGGRLQARSGFLQGVLLDRGSLHAGHRDVRRVFSADANPLVLCLGYLRTRTWVDEVVVGVTSPNELQDIVRAWNAEPHLIDYAFLQSEDLELIDPRRW